jgi:hypothetical protein
MIMLIGSAVLEGEPLVAGLGRASSRWWDPATDTISR